MDACMPFEWRNEFPKELKISPEWRAIYEKNWKNILSL
jgi:hypothetical protein